MVKSVRQKCPHLSVHNSFCIYWQNIDSLKTQLKEDEFKDSTLSNAVAVFFSFFKQNNNKMKKAIGFDGASPLNSFGFN